MAEQLSLQEQQSALKAIYNMVYNHLNSTVPVGFESFEKDNTCIGLFLMQGAVVVKRDILGGFKGLLPFYICYRSYPKTDAQRIAKIDFLNDLAEWISDKKNYPTADCKIIKIEQTTVPFKDESDGSGESDYITTFNMYYEKECV